MTLRVQLTISSKAVACLKYNWYIGLSLTIKTFLYGPQVADHHYKMFFFSTRVSPAGAATGANVIKLFGP
jgi:hypothetical protein